MNRIRKAGKEERAESGIQESKNGNLRILLSLVSCFPDFLLFSWVPVFLICFASVSAQPVAIGSKKFTESYVLGEIAKRTLTDAGIPAEHRQGMGGTIILWQALRGGQIDVYPEYTGTITQEILKSDRSLSLDEIRESLAEFGVGMTEPLGFNNTYALVMRRSEAQRLGVRTISDLRKHPESTGRTAGNRCANDMHLLSKTSSASITRSDTAPSPMDQSMSRTPIRRMQR